MIAFDDTLVAHYGGPGGATLRIAEPGGEFRVVAEFGRDPKTQAAAQRRLLLTREHLFVLEPRAGVLFEEELRVRRFDREGRELDMVEGRGEEGRAQLALLASQEDAGAPLRLRCFGVDPKTGRPLHWSGEIGPQLRNRPWSRLASPAWLGDDLYLPVPGVGLLRCRSTGIEKLAVAARQVQVLDGRLFALTRRAGKTSIWVDGLHSEIGGAPLPPGLYAGFVYGPAGVFAIEEAKGPRMVPAEL